MKVVILCGGLGSRLSEETKIRPKPMVKIGNLPIIVHIMNIYSKYGFNDFILALGYKQKFIVDYFKKKRFKWKIKLVNTGKNTLTGNRLLKLKKYLKNEKTFFLTYGDGVSKINLKRLLNFHKKHKKIATLTAVRPSARFGQLKINEKNTILEFREKNQIDVGWINGGFFVFNSQIFKYLPSHQCMLERYPLNKLANEKELKAFKNTGFWQCMDTLRDKELLNKIWKIDKNKW